VYKDSKISEVFSTLSVVVIENKNMTLKYSGAGDLPIIYKKKSVNEVIKIDSNGLLLGFAKEAIFKDTILQMSPGDSIIITTDGIIESTDINGNQFGADRLLETIKKADSFDAPLKALKSEIINFTSGKFDDDISLAVISAK
jgi:sigma-B regulation protein RsbU (phosphoserine phosphatase)